MYPHVNFLGIILNISAFIFREDFTGSCPGPEFLMLGKDVFSPLAGQGRIFLHLMKDAFWGSMKSAGYAIYDPLLLVAIFCDIHSVLKVFLQQLFSNFSMKHQLNHSQNDRKQ